MNYKNLATYRRKITPILELALKNCLPGGHDEQALPSYLHSNRLAAIVFWERIRAVLSLMEPRGPKDILDFGCGTGVLLPCLSERATKIVGVDPDIRIAQALTRELKTSRTFLYTSLEEALGEHASGYDVIFALDVLEHVPNLEETLTKLRSMLRPSGSIIVSGPTESIVYRLGRWWAGFENHFHVRTQYDVEAAMSKSFEVLLRRRIAFPFSLFRIVEGYPHQS